MKRIFAGIILATLALFGVSAHATPNWPASLSSDSNLLIAVNNCDTTLTVSVTSTATALSVSNTTCFPTVGYVTLDDEALLCTGKTSNSFTGCTRASDGTTATAHTKGALVSHYVVAAMHNALKDELISMSTYFFQGSQVHIATATGKVGIGTSSPNSYLHIGGGTASSFITIGTVTAAPSTFTDATVLFSSHPAGAQTELYVKDGNGNTTLLSPHTEKGEWIYYSFNPETGKVVYINMEHLVRDLEKLLKKKYIYRERQEP